MSRTGKVPRFEITIRAAVLADVAALAEFGAEVVEAAEAIVEDLARGSVTGKELGDRHVSGDLTGLARVKFDAPGQRPQRFRLIYRQVDVDIREVVAIGPRDEHAIYRAAVRRLSDPR